jgi:hypothetical protein
LSQADDKPLLVGLHNRGPLASYNWVEVAETAPDTDEEALFRLIILTLPPGGHIMVEYDSPQRADTARALAQNVPALATALGAQLYRAGTGPRFKDWQIAEGGSEGPRKLQAYLPLTRDYERRWRHDAITELKIFLDRSPTALDVVDQARARAETLLQELQPQ